MFWGPSDTWREAENPRRHTLRLSRFMPGWSTQQKCCRTTVLECMQVGWTPTWPTPALRHRRSHATWPTLEGTWHCTDVGCLFCILRPDFPVLPWRFYPALVGQTAPTRLQTPGFWLGRSDGEAALTSQAWDRPHLWPREIKFHTDLRSESTRRTTTLIL